MPRFSANISMMFTELPFELRFAAAAEAGFNAIECLFPYALPAEQVAELLNSQQLAVSVFNLSPGDWDGGERGLAALAGREQQFAQSVEQALHYATAMGAKQLHVMAGIASWDEDSLTRYCDNLRLACKLAKQRGITLMIEPINPRDMPGYLLNNCDQALEVIERVGCDNLRLQWDIYHHQIVRGDVLTSLERLLPYIQHIQIASVPKRQEPVAGELNYPAIFEALDELGYVGWVGCEYRPAGATLDGLEWLQPWVAS